MRIETGMCMTLGSLTEDIIPPNQKWTLIGRYVSEPFNSGRRGLMVGQLFAVIAKIYSRLDDERDKIEWVYDGEKGYASFWGDHTFVEMIDVNFDEKTVTLSLGS